MPVSAIDRKSWGITRPVTWLLCLNIFMYFQVRIYLQLYGHTA